MKASTKGNVEGTMHQVNGTIKAADGKVTANHDLKIEGKSFASTSTLQSTG